MIRCMLVLILATPFGAWAQDVTLLPCPQVAFFTPACVPAEGAEQLPTLPPPVLSREPLFPPETLARDTPPLMRTLLDHPSPEQARAFLDWQAERTARIAEVQQLLRTLTRAQSTP